MRVSSELGLMVEDYTLFLVSRFSTSCRGSCGRPKSARVAGRPGRTWDRMCVYAGGCTYVCVGEWVDCV